MTTALRLLRLVADRGQIRVTEASEALGIGTSTSHRLLVTLEAERFVERDRVTRAYRPGRMLLELGLTSLGDLDIRRLAQPHMSALAAGIDETVHLLMLQGHEVRFIDGVESRQLIKVSLRTGTTLPAHSTSGGKLLLAELPRDVVAEVLTERLASVTSSTIDSLDDLLDELDEIRRLGYAINRGESDEQLRAVAVPIRHHSGRAIAALAVSTPTDRGQAERLRGFLGQMRAAAAAIAADLEAQRP